MEKNQSKDPSKFAETLLEMTSRWLFPSVSQIGALRRGSQVGSRQQRRKQKRHKPQTSSFGVCSEHSGLGYWVRNGVGGCGVGVVMCWGVAGRVGGRDWGSKLCMCARIWMYWGSLGAMLGLCYPVPWPGCCYNLAIWGSNGGSSQEMGVKKRV